MEETLPSNRPVKGWNLQNKSHRSCRSARTPVPVCVWAEMLGFKELKVLGRKTAIMRLTLWVMKVLSLTPLHKSVQGSAAGDRGPRVLW